MDTAKTVHNVSANLFFVMAFFYAAAALAFRNGYNPGTVLFLMRLLDIPFAFIALLYGGTGLYLQVNEGREEGGSVWGVVIFAICLILFGAVVFMNFAFPSKL